jgi:hypothetical protein
MQSEICQNRKIQNTSAGQSSRGLQEPIRNHLGTRNRNHLAQKARPLKARTGNGKFGSWLLNAVSITMLTSSSMDLSQKPLAAWQKIKFFGL